MRPPAHSPVPPLLLLLSCPRGIYRCVQLLLLLLLLLIVSGGTARAGRGRRATSVSPDLLPHWLVRHQVTNMSREFHDSWGACGSKWEMPRHCGGHVHLRHHGRGHCNSPDYLVQHVCDARSGRMRTQRLRKLRAPHCGLWTNTSHWGQEVAESTEKCFRTLRHLLHMDDLVGAAVCRYSRILARYDCHAATSFLAANLSPHHSMCDLCQEAYRYWVCSQLFPYFVDGERMKPCRSFCHAVEQKCPYFLPKYKPVAGEPTFLCQDPDIGELQEQEQESSYGNDSCCYVMCSTGEAMGHLPGSDDHRTNSTLCPICNSRLPTTASSTTTTSATAAAAATSSAGGSMSPIAPDPSEANLKCLSTKDSCSRHSGPGPAPPLSSSGCPFVLRKHCWTPKALYILLLFLVRTDLWLPRGFT